MATEEISEGLGVQATLEKLKQGDWLEQEGSSLRRLRHRTRAKLLITVGIPEGGDEGCGKGNRVTLKEIS